jgi:hypothetical protein
VVTFVGHGLVLSVAQAVRCLVVGYFFSGDRMQKFMAMA